MPNHVSNKIKFTGGKDAVEKLVSMIVDKSGEKHEVDFGLLIPEPEDYASELVKTDNRLMSGLPGWYIWRCANWGTKWNAYDCDVEYGDGCLTVSFSTAWACPEKWIEKVIRVCRELDISVDGIFADEDCASSNYGVIHNEGCTFNPGDLKRDIYEELWDMDLDEIYEECDDTDDD